MSVSSAQVERMHSHINSTPFWPQDLERLVVVTMHDGNTGTCIAYGLDPGRWHLVFQVELQPAQLTALIDALRAGYKAARTGSQAESVIAKDSPSPANNGEGGDGGAVPLVVVIPGPGPDDPGPKAAALAVEIHEAIRKAHSAFANQ
jgi:hypothetical protein